ncbi:MAG: transcriptional regulator [Tannerellaceae bacterium]|nr:transcriptional regulator [Tannerellaceae bacterium]
MGRRKQQLLPRVEETLNRLGEDIKLARLRRKFGTKLVAERASIARSTLWLIEKGNPQVSIGNYAQVLFVLGLDLSTVASDTLGRKLQDAEIAVKQRAPKKEEEAIEECL